MQLVIELPDKLAKKYSKSQLKKMIAESIKEKAEDEQDLVNDPFFKWAGKPEKLKEKDLARNHDKYLYEQK